MVGEKGLFKKRALLEQGHFQGLKRTGAEA
jgi:hypothetical protein